MKTKKKRVGSFLCFVAPDTDETEKDEKKKEGPVNDSTDVGRSVKKTRRRLMSTIEESISFRSKSSNWGEKLPKEPSPSQSRKISDSSENQSASGSDSFLKNSDAAIFSSSSSASLCCAAAAAASALITPEPKLQQNKTFVPPPAPRNHGYATGLFLLLLSLFVVVFCGRVGAILWTATWLCLVPRRRMAWRPPEFSDVSAEVTVAEVRKEACCREEEKNRIVLEGFLQRNKKSLN